MLSLTTDDLRLFLHVLAAAIWVGGQFTLGALVPALRRAGADVPKQVARQFGRIAWPAFGVLIATGIWNIVAIRHDLSHSSSYRGTLYAKLALAVLSGVAAFAHQRATSRRGLALGGAAAAVFALLALFYGVVLDEGG